MSFKICLLFGCSSIIFKTSWTFSYLSLNLLLSLAFSNHFLFSISMMSSRLISSSSNLIRMSSSIPYIQGQTLLYVFCFEIFLWESHTSFVLRTESGLKLGYFIKAIKYMYHKIKRYLIFSLSVNCAKVFLLFAIFKLEYKFLLTLSIIYKSFSIKSCNQYGYQRFNFWFNLGFQIACKLDFVFIKICSPKLKFRSKMVNTWIILNA